MYPQLNNDLPLNRCTQCHLLKVACLCGQVPELESQAIFFLLVHQRELAKGSNTGHLVFNALNNADYELWARVEPPQKLMALLQSPAHQGYLLFTNDSTARADASGRSAHSAPDENTSAVIVESPTPSKVDLGGGKTPVLILIDATWQQARKMVRQSSYLKDLPRVSLSLQQQSQYRLRRNQLDVGMSTCEAAVGLLEELGEADNACALQQYFLDFMRHYDASMSGHGVD